MLNHLFDSWKNVRQYKKKHGLENDNEQEIHDLLSEKIDKNEERERMVRNGRPTYSSEVKETTIFFTANKYIPLKDKVKCEKYLVIIILFFLIFFQFLDDFFYHVLCLLLPDCAFNLLDGRERFRSRQWKAILGD